MRLQSSFFFGSVIVGRTLAALQRPLLAYQDQSRIPLDEVFDQKAKWACEHFDIPGLAVAVVRGEVFSKGYGVSDIDTSEPVTEHTLFFTGSTTKAFTSAAISLLVDDDNYPTIQWDTPVHNILPTDFVLDDPWSTSHTTIADILSHRSGLPRHDWVWLANITLQETVQSMRHLPLTAEPRTKWQYCNLMYSAAAHLIETVTNQSLHTFLTKKIWQPLNMTETFLSLPDARAARHDISQGYYVNLDGKISSTNQVFTDTIRGAGNTLSSVTDYSKWILAILNRQPPLSEASYDTLIGGHAIISPNPIEPFGSPLLYGLGWMSQTYKGEMLVFHEGSQFGYGASVMLLPRRKFGLVVLGNNMNGINAAGNVLAYHLIDEELGISMDDRFDWVTRYLNQWTRKPIVGHFKVVTNDNWNGYRADAVINDTRLPENIVSKLYPMVPNPPLANPLNISTYEGTYTHPAYPDLKISSSCSDRKQAIQWVGRSIPDLCATIVNYNGYSQNLILDLFHVSGTFWIQIATRWGVPNANRAEFLINSEGTVSWLGIEIEPLMAIHEEKIWWKRS